jgi:hypothetical protein
MRTIEQYAGSCVCGIRLLVRIEFPTPEAADRTMAERRGGFESDCPSCGWRQAIAMELLNDMADEHGEGGRRSVL